MESSILLMWATITNILAKHNLWLKSGNNFLMYLNTTPQDEPYIRIIIGPNIYGKTYRRH